MSIVPEDSISLIAFKRTELTGHYGNPITLLETRIEDRALALKSLDKIAEGLSTLDKAQLSDNFERHMEKGNVYLRLDKQAAYNGKLRLESGDPIHIKIHFKPSSQKELIAICQQHGLLP